MRTHEHREESTTLWGLLGESRGGTMMAGVWGEIAWGEMPGIGDGEEGSKLHSMCVPMQQSCMFFTCTPKPKMQ